MLESKQHANNEDRPAQTERKPLEVPPPPLLPNFGGDAGSRARQKVQERAKRTFWKRVWGWVKWSLIVAVTAALLVAGGIVYHEWDNSVQRRASIYRDCAVVINPGQKNEWTLTGKRTYSYLERELFGVSFHHTGDVSTQTQIDLNGRNIVTIALTADNRWKGTVNSMGERGIQILPEAKTYVFVVDGKEATAIASTSFCK